VSLSLLKDLKSFINLLLFTLLLIKTFKL